MKEQILKLREEGKSYNEIVEILGCAKSTVSYHCGKGQKEKTAKRQRNRRYTKRQLLQKKLDKFKNRLLNMKIRDFQRQRDLKGYWKGEGKYKEKFKEETLLTKLIESPICYLTGQEIDLTKPSSYSLDHIEPVSKGGLSTLSNLGLCKKEANMAKHNLSVDEFINLCKEVIEHNGYKINRE